VHEQKDRQDVAEAEAAEASASQPTAVAPAGLAPDKQRELIDDLLALVTDRAKAEQEIEKRSRAREATVKKEEKERRKQLTEEYEKDSTAAEEQYRKAKTKIGAQSAKRRDAVQAEYDRARKQLTQGSEQGVREAKNEWNAARRQAVESFKTQRLEHIKRLRESRAGLDAKWQQLQSLEGLARWILNRRRCPLPDEAEQPEAQEDQTGPETSAEASAGGGGNPSPETAEGEARSPGIAEAQAETGDAEAESSPAQDQKNPADALSAGLGESLPGAEDEGSDKPVLDLDEAQAQYQAAAETANSKLESLRRQFVPGLIEGDRPYAIFFLVALAAAFPFILLFGGWENWYWIAASLATGVVSALLVVAGIGPIARRQSLAAFDELLAAKREAEEALNAELAAYRSEIEEQLREHAKQRDAAIAEADAKWQQVSGTSTADQQQRLERAAEKYRPQLEEIDETRRSELAKLDEEHRERTARRKQEFDDELARLEAEIEKQLAESREEYQKAWNDLIRRWSDGVSRFTTAVDAMNRFCAETFPPWDEIGWETWQPPTSTVPALPVGDYEFSLQKVKHGVPQDERLAVERTDFRLPATLSFPGCPSLLLEASGAGRDVAVSALQNAMLRLLTSMPPGKVRFTIVDPTGLGQNFSAFMHLTDYDERLVSMRIWTETTHINQRLTDLTEHMEKVIQKYLRNEFESIEEYNQHAGEVAEAFQILVVANFPANFSEEAARRLVSIASSGARCGVYTLISVDTKMKLPRNFDLSDLETDAVHFVWKDDRFCWKDPKLKEWPLTLEMPPEHEKFSNGVKTVGQHAVDSNRVEVPFRTIVPEEEQWWSQDSRSEIVAPLGRAGATKLQYMRLGKGTSQHVLIAGKTGSGKSTLLHALITSLAIHYNPHQVHFYLVDFKKGVEFKAYAKHRLPHARVIAIESEREFGLSVLERLDLELRKRGDLFRERGVQDVRGFRNAHPDTPLPRVLLIVDEFQELFVKDDKIAQDAGLLLDRLVRQGRAFGIHVLLGSQTLAGAYSLARSTLGQMAVRIALQCSEGDAHLILSEDNTAARLLSRPGEAIYNDANGMFEGNHPFQVVWLPDGERDNFLRQVSLRSQRQEIALPATVVFEGNQPADPADNDLLREALTQPVSKARALAPRAWLGAAVAIKEPTSATFGRHGGSNLLIVGQEEEMALGLLTTCLVSLAAQQPPANSDGDASAARFYVFDAPRPDDEYAAYWEEIVETLPGNIQLVTPRNVADVISQIAEQVRERTSHEEAAVSPIYLIVNNLARFRDLRKSEDDLMFSLDEDEDKPASPGKLLKEILRDGPPSNVHSLLWCDSYTNCTRWIDRESMRELEMKVVFQVSLSDSSNLIDSPAAGRLGQNRAIFYHEEQGRLEKFRPYGPPDKEWLTWVRQQLDARQVDRSSA